MSTMPTMLVDTVGFIWLFLNKSRMSLAIITVQEMGTSTFVICVNKQPVGAPFTGCFCVKKHKAIWQLIINILMQYFFVSRKWIRRVVVELSNKKESPSLNTMRATNMRPIHIIKAASSWRQKNAEEMKCQFCWQLSHIYILFTVNIAIRLSLRHITQI